MNNKELESKIKESFNQITPDVFESVVNDCKSNKGGTVTMTENKKVFKFNKKFLAIAAAFVVAVLAVSGVALRYNSNVEAARVYLDVNPSVEISVNNNKVLEAKAANADGEKILEGMDLKNTDLKVALNAVLGSMMKNGYINEAANSILVSVDGKKAETLKADVSSDVAKFIQENGVDSAILTQDLTDNNKTDDVKTFAEKYGLSESKAKYILDLVASNPKYKAEDLVGLTVNELNVLSKDGNEDFANSNSTGTPSEEKYIGKDSAKAIALEHLGISESDTEKLKVDFDVETVKGVKKMVYEVEFILGDTEYDIDVDAENGEILDVDKELVEKPNIDKPEDNKNSDDKVDVDDKDDDDDDKDHDDKNDNKIDKEDIIPEGSYIGEEAAKNIAFSHAGVSAADAVKVKCKMENEKTGVVYEIDFECGNLEYDYEIDAVTGSVVDHEVEPK